MLLYLITFIICFSRTVISLTIPKAQVLLPGKDYNCCHQEPYASNRNVPVIYCFKGLSKSVFRVWMSASVKTTLNSGNYDLYEGWDSNDVLAKFAIQRSSWSSDWLNWHRKQIELNPFNSTCFGIQTDQDYTLKLQITDLDVFLLALFGLGIILFYNSSILSHNALFYYITAIIIGMSASLLILLYFMLKLLPLKKPIVIGGMVGGAVATSYIIQFLSTNFYSILLNYQKYIIGYLSLSALISVTLYYRFGPVTDPRSKTLIKYGLQVIASAMIYYSSYCTEASQVTLVVLLVVTNVPFLYWISPFKCLGGWIWRRFKPLTPRELLTEEEYRREGVVETSKALSGLREYCNSPEFCTKWQVVLGLHDQAKFATFMREGSHVSKQEVTLHRDIRRRLEPDSDESDEEL